LKYCLAMIPVTPDHDRQVPCEMARKGDTVVGTVSFDVEDDLTGLFERDITQDGFLQLAGPPVGARVVVLLETWGDGW
jgi:hypothetical protein